MKIERFEDLKVWKDAKNLATEIYKLTSNEKFKKDFGLREQIQRSSVSTLSNIAEGYERNNNKEFIKFLVYAKGSAGEVRAQLHLAYSIGYVSESDFKSVYEKVVDISQQLSNFIKYLRKNL
ncbi:MAG: four helix bundle protein [Elusimicrobiota bacterium]